MRNLRNPAWIYLKALLFLFLRQTTVTGASSTNQRQYTARENDSTALYFYSARYYNPLGRFILLRYERQSRR